MQNTPWRILLCWIVMSGTLLQPPESQKFGNTATDTGKIGCGKFGAIPENTSKMNYRCEFARFAATKRPQTYQNRMEHLCWMYFSGTAPNFPKPIFPVSVAVFPNFCDSGGCNRVRDITIVGRGCGPWCPGPGHAYGHCHGNGHGHNHGL